MGEGVGDGVGAGVGLNQNSSDRQALMHEAQVATIGEGL